MTVQELFSYVGDIKPHAFSEEQLTIWLNEIESRIQAEVLLWPPVECFRYRWPDSQNDELLLESPDEAIYRHWMEAMIDYANGEYGKYQNAMALFNASWNAFVCRFGNFYRPADGYVGTWKEGSFL